MLVVRQGPTGSLAARRVPSKPNPKPYSTPLFVFADQNPRCRTLLSPAPLAFSDNVGPSTSTTTTTTSSSISFCHRADLLGVSGDRVPLEGGVQLEKPRAGAESKLLSVAKVGLLACGDILCLLMFVAIGRFILELPVFVVESLKIADPFVAGWLLSASFFGGYGDDAKGSNGVGKAVAVAAMSWLAGVPLGLAIRAAMSGHTPTVAFFLITMAMTGSLLISWRALASKFPSSTRSKG